MRYVWILLHGDGRFRGAYESSASGMAACESRDWVGDDEGGWWGSKDSDVVERVVVYP